MTHRSDLQTWSDKSGKLGYKTNISNSNYELSIIHHTNISTKERQTVSLQVWQKKLLNESRCSIKKSINSRFKSNQLRKHFHCGLNPNKQLLAAVGWSIAPQAISAQHRLGERLQSRGWYLMKALSENLKGQKLKSKYTRNLLSCFGKPVMHWSFARNVTNSPSFILPERTLSKLSNRPARVSRELPPSATFKCPVVPLGRN